MSDARALSVSKRALVFSVRVTARPGPSQVKKEPENRHLLGCFGLQKVDFLKITPKSAIFDGEMRSKSGQFYVTLGQVPFLDPSNRWFLGVK